MLLPCKLYSILLYQSLYKRHIQQLFLKNISNQVSYLYFLYLYLKLSFDANFYKYTSQSTGNLSIEDIMRIFNLKFLAVLLLMSLSQTTLQAQTPEEQQRIREMRLLEWHAQEQAQLQPTQTQNVSLNQPYQPAPEATAAPDREDLFNAASAGNIQQIGKLLSDGLDVNVSNVERETALHMAAARGHYEAVMFLVRNGAYVNAPTIKNWIPLHHAVRFRHPNIVNFLIQRGSSASARTSDGLSAIDMAKNNRDYRLLSIMGAR